MRIKVEIAPRGHSATSKRGIYEGRTYVAAVLDDNGDILATTKRHPTYSDAFGDAFQKRKALRAKGVA